MEGQLNLWNWGNNAPSTFKINNKIRLIETFAGIGAQAKALELLGVEFEHWKVIEFDKYPCASYEAIHNVKVEPTDITQVKGIDLQIVDTNQYTYLLTYSFPCQSLSIAGKGHGMAKGSGTRSGLLWEVERLLEECDTLTKMDPDTYGLPQVLIMENVPQVHSSKNMADFQLWLDFLESKGYHNFWKDLNSRDYGVAQNRNRCFCVSLLSDKPYEFPEPIELKKCMADYLEEEVDEKYYISSEREDKLIEQLIADGKLE